MIRRARLEAVGARLESLSYQRTLQRGYALVRDGDDTIVATAAAARAAAALSIEFADGRLDVVRAGDDTGTRRRKPRPQDDPAPSQGSLL